MIPVLSKRSKEIPASPIRKFAPLAYQAKQAGKEVFFLNIGQPDIQSPIEFFEGLNKYSCNVVEYEKSQGNDQLRNAWINKLNTSLKINLNENQMIITIGASEAINFLFLTICDPGDEVIVLDPTYANYIGFAACCNVNLKPLLCDISNGFSLPNCSSIEQQITSNTKAILLCNPNNPTGAVYDIEDLKTLLDICERYNLFFLVDEVYREFVYDNKQPCSILKIASHNNRVVVIDSLSKHYSLCGARIGCIITSNEELIFKITNLTQARLAAPTIEQYAAAFMLNHIKPEYFTQIKHEYKLRRDVVYDILSDIKNINLYKPAGAFYFVIGFPIKNADEFVSFMLTDFSYNNKTTFVAPASGFYLNKHVGQNQIRIAYVLDTKRLKEATSILVMGLEAFLKKQRT